LDELVAAGKIRIGAESKKQKAESFLGEYEKLPLNAFFWSFGLSRLSD